ncbi:MAG: hypothetical protein AAFX44_09945 [Pseudomonadota bacterium]
MKAIRTLSVSDFRCRHLPVIAFALAAPVAASGESLQGECGAADDVSRAHVTDVYPSGSRLPANLLRFYVYFSKPMNREQVISAVTLRDSDDLPVDGAFLPTRFALWSDDSRRLTLLLDPGRVKTGLRAHDELGRALVAGDTYTLRIGDAAEDASGCTLQAAFDKPFKVVAPLVRQPSLAAWQLDVPTAGTREPLLVTLDGPYDHLSLAYRLRVRAGDDTTVPGRIELADNERVWQFTPRNAWRERSYTLAVERELEDLAGNRLGALFDQPLADRGPEPTNADLRRHFNPMR